MYEETKCQDIMYLRWAEHLQRAALQQVAATTTAEAAMAATAEAGAGEPDLHSNGVELTRVEHVMSKRNLLIRVKR